MTKYQFTLFSDKYKPVSTVVEADNMLQILKHEKPYFKAIEKICAKRCWQPSDLQKYGYTKSKVRKWEGA